MQYDFTGMFGGFLYIPLQHILACLRGIFMAKILDVLLKRESVKFNSLVATEIHLFSYIK